MSQLPLRQHIEHVALVFPGVQRLFQLPAAARLIEGHSGVMPRHQAVKAPLQRIVQHGVKLHVAVAVDAGIGRQPVFIGVEEIPDHPFMEQGGVFQHLKGHPEAKRHIPGVVHIGLGAAAFMTGLPDIAAAIELHGRPRAVEALLPHQPGRDGAVHAAAHGDQSPFHPVTRFPQRFTYHTTVFPPRKGGKRRDCKAGPGMIQ